MIDDIRNWFGDIASGKIKDAHLALSEATARDFHRQLTETIAENNLIRSHLKELAAEKVILQTKNSELEAKLNEITAKQKQTDEPNQELLQLLFEHEDGLDVATIAARMSMTTGVAKFHLGVLLDLKYVDFDAGSVGFGGQGYDGEPSFYAGTPETYWIEQLGRAYIMKKRG